MKYSEGFKTTAVDLASKLGLAKAHRELCLPKSTLYTWIRKADCEKRNQDAEVSLPETEKPDTNGANAAAELSIAVPLGEVQKRKNTNLIVWLRIHFLSQHSTNKESRNG